MYVIDQFSKMIDALWSLGFTLIFIVAIYLIPVFIAYSRKLEKRPILTIVNIFLGWTFLAWIACIAWAIWEKTSEKLQTEPVV